MNDLHSWVHDYLEYCRFQKNLDDKTLKAYRIDLEQFLQIVLPFSADPTGRSSVTRYITEIHKLYKPKSIKRKIASVKAFFITWNTRSFWRPIPSAGSTSNSASPRSCPRLSPFI